MLKLDDFKVLAKSQVLNLRYVSGGYGVATEYSGGDDWLYEDRAISYSGHVKRGGNTVDDPR